MKYYDEFVKGNWCKKIDVENFIELNYKEYLGDEKFLCKSTPKTNLVMEKVNDLLKKELNKKVILEDERLTTRIAENILIKSDISRKKRKKVIDKMSATVILQSYLDKVKRE